MEDRVMSYVFEVPAQITGQEANPNEKLFHLFTFISI